MLTRCTLLIVAPVRIDDGRRQRAPITSDESDRPSLRERARYRLDNLLARGTVATLISLGIVAASAVLVSSLLLTIFGVTFSGSQDGRWLEDLWQSMLRVLDPGTMAADVGWGRRLLALIVTIFGLLVAGTLIGIIANGVEDRVDSMRRGRSAVIEAGHLVVVGGTDRLAMVIRQLALANQGHPPNTVVVLADRDPGELHNVVRKHLRGLEGTRVVYRSGDPTRRSDLEIVRLGRARGIVVLADGDSDIAAVKTVLAITSELGGRHDIPVVVELSDQGMAALLADACPGVEPIVPQEAMARIAAFALRQRGLSQVVLELTQAGGSNIYVVERLDVIGLPFGRLVGRYENAVPIGRFGADASIELNPPPERQLEPGDRLIMVSTGAEPLERSEPVGELQHTGTWSPATENRVHDEHLAVVGWDTLGAHLLEGWAVSASPESTVTIFHDGQHTDAAQIVIPDVGVPVQLVPMNHLSDVLSGHPRTTVIVLGRQGVDVMEADAHTVVDVRMLQQLAQRSSQPTPRFVVELRDPDNAELLDLDGFDDYIVSTAFAGQFLAQLVEQPERRRILLQMYTANDPSLQLIGCEQLGGDGTRRFSEIVETAYRAGALAIGWRTSSPSGAQLVLGPTASSTVTLRPGDEIVVVA
jgi:ion channel POLLUX/CASTOR